MQSDETTETAQGQEGQQGAEDTAKAEGQAEAANNVQQGEAAEGNAQDTEGEATQAPDMRAMYEQAMKRNDELAEQLATLLDSVGKLIESGAAFGNQQGSEPQRRNPSPDEKKLDAIMEGVKNAN